MENFNHNLFLELFSLLDYQEMFNLTSTCTALRSLRNDQEFLSKLAYLLFGIQIPSHIKLNLLDFPIIDQLNTFEPPTYQLTDELELNKDKYPFFTNYLLQTEFEAWVKGTKSRVFQVVPFRFKSEGYNWHHLDLIGVKVRAFTYEGAILSLSRDYPQENLIPSIVTRYHYSIPFGRHRDFIETSIDNKMCNKIIANFIKGNKYCSITLKTKI